MWTASKPPPQSPLPSWEWPNFDLLSSSASLTLSCDKISKRPRLSQQQQQQQQYPSLRLSNDITSPRTSPLRAPNTANIPAPSSTFFTTDHRQPWPSPTSPHLRLQPEPPQAPPLPLLRDANYPPALDTDFVLFPSASPLHQQQQTAARSARQPAEQLAPRLARNPSDSPLINTNNNSNNIINGQTPHRRNSAQQSPSPAQNPRVSQIIKNTGHSPSFSSFNSFNHPGTKPAFYASSAPSSTLALQQQKQHSQAQSSPISRPPVPLFPSNSTGNVHRASYLQQTKQRTMSSSHISQGNTAAPLAVTGPSSSTNPLTSYRPDLSIFNFQMPSNLDDYNDAPLFASTYSSPHLAGSSVDSMAHSGTSSTHNGTVSPKDLMMDPLAFSAPNSTSFTNLTSPSIYDSPDIGDVYETSPLFDPADGDVPSADSWYSLFPPTCTSDNSPSDQLDDIQDPATLALAQAAISNRRRSSPNQPPRGIPAKHSTVSGVGSRKRDKPLPPIVVDDPTDSVAAKRARNTLAARKSRQKKVEKFEELETKIAELENEVEHWKRIALGKSSGMPSI
ncbi:MAG: hypothetical protein M1829_003918 [Trizodia sp. TS-e1964]|nr:MAG: hypothetical protein M1829_003918 [Trizodia sp. TS-e1964]